MRGAERYLTLLATGGGCALLILHAPRWTARAAAHAAALSLEALCEQALQMTKFRGMLRR